MSARLAPVSAAPEPAAGRLPAGVAAVAAAVAAFLGYLVAAEPRFLHLSLAFDGRTVAALLAGLGLCALTLLRPGWGLELLVVFVYLNLSQVLVRQHHLPSLLQMLAVPLAVSAWLRRRRTDLGRLLTRPLTVWLGVYALVVLASSALARDRALADERLAEHLKALGVYLLVSLLAWSPRVLRRGVWALVASGALLGAIVLVQSATGNLRNEYLGLARIKYAQIYGSVLEPRLAGPLGDPNFFAQVLVMLVPLALFTAWEARRATARAFAVAAAALVTAAAILTYSRGGALALGGVLALSLLSRRARLREVSAGLGLLALLLLLVPAGFTRRLETISQILPGQEEEVLKPDSSFEQRKLLTAVAWRMFLDRPLLGVGVGNYTVHFDDYAEEVGSVAREYEGLGERHYPHSLYLEVAAETGLVGLVAFAAVLLAAFSSLHRARGAFRGGGDPRLASFCRAFEIALAGYLVTSLFLHGDFARYLWMLFGFAAALEHLAPSGRPAPAGERRGSASA